jgi:crotonobetainyl-CoA:carnitine CoA-transferase CaiB-like acyl-CoA transferase
MQDALLAWLPNVVGPPLAEHRDPQVAQERSWGGNAMYRLYRCADGRWLALGGAEHKFADVLFAALGRPDLGALCHLPPGAAQDPAKQFLAATFATQALSHWCAVLAPLDICWAPVRTLTEALDDPHTRARGMVFTDAAGGTHLGIPIRFREEPGRISPRLEALGASTAELFAHPHFDPH